VCVVSKGMIEYTQKDITQHNKTKAQSKRKESDRSPPPSTPSTQAGRGMDDLRHGWRGGLERGGGGVEGSEGAGIGMLIDRRDARASTVLYYLEIEIW
jgi:hypothetical protein